MSLPINLIPNKLYRQLFHSEQAVCPEWLEKIICDELTAKGMGDVVDNSELPNIPFPKLDKPLPQWIEHNAKAVYGKYHKWNNELSETIAGTFNPYQNKLKYPTFEQLDIPENAPKSGGWHKAIDGEWVQVTELPKVLLLDFETVQCATLHTKFLNEWLPFICCAIDLEGDWYCWKYDDIENLSRVVSFPGLEYGIGHNVVAYDRRYIKEAYDFDTQLRFFDTFAMYHMLMGMASTSQRVQFLLCHNNGITKSDWMNETSLGGLDALYQHFTNEPLDKSVRKDIQNYDRYQVAENIDEIYRYCMKDVYANLIVFRELWQKWQEHCPSIVTLAGQIERSTFRLGVRKDYFQRLANIDAQILALKVKRNEQILEWLEISKDYPHLKDYGNQWIEKEYEKRKADAKNPDKIKPKNWEGFIKNLWTKAKDESKLATTPERYIPITSKALVYALQIKWNGYQLEHNGQTWGINESWMCKNNVQRYTAWRDLPHPKGDNNNVGTPLAKDFKSKAVTGEFSSPVTDLVKVFSTIGIIGTWQSFRDRLYGAYIYNDIWLTDNVPCGTVSERIAGTGVVLPNTNPEKAGTEIKHFFGVVDRKNNVKLDGDYASQENLIFAGIADAKRGYIGSTPSSVLTLSGTDAHDRTGNIILGMLDSQQISELEKSYGTPLLKKLRVLWKNINYANQFLCGKNKQAGQIFLAVQGKLPYENCFDISNSFIDESRGVLEYGIYKNGFASDAYNGCKQNMQQPIQRSFIYKRAISAALQKRYCGGDFATTRFNFNIQQTGQELVNTCLVVMRILQTMIKQQQNLYIPYHTMNVVHDQCLFETPKTHAKDGTWLFQMGHAFSKCMFYDAIGIKQIPITGLLLDTIEIDQIWRKSPKDKGITPSKTTPSLPLGFAVDAKQCSPKSSISMDFESLPVGDIHNIDSELDFLTVQRYTDDSEQVKEEIIIEADAIVKREKMEARLKETWDKDYEKVVLKDDVPF
jgi:DNA mitochondrial polymerase exonuclease domain